MKTPRKPKRRKPQQRFYQPFVPCESCASGWLTDASGAAFRCSCWRAFVAKAAEADARELKASER